MASALKKSVLPQQDPVAQPESSFGDQGEVFYRDDGLLRVAGPIMVVCYTLLFAVAAATFFSTGAALFAVGVSAAFAIVFFAIPILFLRTRAARDSRWRRDAANASRPEVEVWTGSLRRYEAIIQIVSIPVAVLIGFTLLSIGWSLQ